MAPKKRPMTGLLLKPIHINDAQARGLRASFALDPDDSDKLVHIEEQLRARWAELDRFFGLRDNGKGVDIWQERAKALVAYKFDVDSRDPQWWGRFTIKLVCRNVRGFSLKRPGERKHGAPLEWNNRKLCQLFSDVEFLKKTTGRSVRDICKTLPRRKGYAERWGRHRSEGLRKAYAKANRLRRDRLFPFELCGVEAIIPADRSDHIAAAIELHALKD